MKRLIPILFAAMVLVSCQKEPNLSELSSDYVVYTDYDKSEDFANYNTYYLPDSVLVIGNSEKATYWTGDQAKFLLDVFVDNMNAKGFSRVELRENADLGLQVSYIENTRYFVNYPNYWWWWGYPGYWGPGYWGPYWNDWYYPYYPNYPTVYSYSTNSFLAELVDLKDKPATLTQEARRLEVIWNSYMVGAQGGSAQANKKLVERAVDQAFTQSPYLTNK